MKKLTFLISVILILFLFGCSKSTSSVSKEIDIFVGTGGLSVEFAKNAPPPRVFESSDFPIMLRIRNQGAFSITQEATGSSGLKGLLSINREKDYVPIVTFEENGRVSKGDYENEAYFYVDGKTQLNQKGDEAIVAINAKTGKLDPQSEHRQSTIIASLCYPYKTVLSTTICIDSDVAGIRPGKKACTVKELTFNNGQGAPIAVTRIEPQMVPEGDKIKPQFLIFIENKGKGTPVDISNYVHACRETDADKKNIWNAAYLNVYSTFGGENKQLVCSPSEASIEQKTGFIRLRDKKDFVKCTFKEAIPRDTDAYTSPLRVEIDYGYIQTASANLIVQKPIKY